MRKVESKKIQAGVVIIATMMLLVSSVSAIVANRDISEVRQYIPEVEENVIELGSIKAEISNCTFGIVSPIIDIPDTMILEFNASKTMNDTYIVDNVLRINIDVVGNNSRNFLIGRYITTIVSIIRNYRGRIFLGKMLTINRTNVLTDGEKYIEIPLKYEVSRILLSEDVTIHIAVIGTAWGKIFSPESKPVFAYKRISTEIRYTFNNSNVDVTAPVTLCFLEGELLNGTYVTDVTVFLSPDDGGTGVDYTMYSYSWFKDGVGMQTGWMVYEDIVVFSADGSYGVQYYSVDNVGNEETIKSRAFSIQYGM